MKLLNGIFTLLNSLFLLFSLVNAGYQWIFKNNTLEAIMYMSIAIFLEISYYADRKKDSGNS